MGERYLAQSPLRVFIQYARLNPGSNESMQQQVGLRQVGRRIKPHHDGRLIIHAKPYFDLDLPVRHLAVHEMTAGFDHLEPIQVPH